MRGEKPTMRAIIRWSLNADVGGRLRNSFVPGLTNHGFRSIGTAAMESDISESDLRHAMRDFWNTLANFTGNSHLDHFWMYVDNPLINAPLLAPLKKARKKAQRKKSGWASRACLIICIFKLRHHPRMTMER